MITNNRFGAIDITVLVLYFVAVAATGIYAMCASKRDTASGYFLAGRFMTFIPIGASLFASNIGSEHFLGISGSAAAAGIGVGAYELNAMIVLQVLGFVFVPVYISSGVITLPEYLKKRFGGKRIPVVLSAISLALYILTKISVNLYSGALFINTALGWELAGSLALIIGLSAFCTVTGGLAAVIYTDTVQAFLMVAGALTLMVFGFAEVGGISQLYEEYMQARPSNLTGVPAGCGEPRPDSLILLRDPVGTDMPWPGFLFGFTTVSIWYWCADQVIVQRSLSTKNLAHAQGATIFAGYLKALPLFVLVMPGMVSRVLFPDEIACAHPDVCEQVCGNRAGCSNFAYPKLIMEIMPVGLRGLMVAVLLAALVTALTSIFNSASSLFTVDIYPLFKKNPSNREQMIVGRVFAMVMTVISILWVPVVRSTQGGQLFLYIQAVQSYLTPPIAAIFLVAVLWPRANEQGAFWALIVGMITGGVRLVLEFVYQAPPCGEKETRPVGIRSMNYMYFALIGFWITVIVMVVVSLFTKPLAKWRGIRTVFWHRFDDTVRPDEMPLSRDAMSLVSSAIETKAPTAELDASDTEAEAKPLQTVEIVSLAEKKNEVVFDEGGEGGEGGCCQRLGVPPSTDPATGRRKSTKQFVISWSGWLLGWFCGFSVMKSSQKLDEAPSGLAMQQDEAEQHVKRLVKNIEQDYRTRLLLLINLVLILAVCVFLNIFFSLPPEIVGIVDPDYLVRSQNGVTTNNSAPPL